MYFIVDILFNFRTQYEHENGTMVTDSRAIALNYVKGWFILDLLSCMSFVGYFLSDDGASSASSARMGKTLRVVRISKLLRLARLERTLSKMDYDIGPLVKGVGILISSLLGFHMIGCFWHWAGGMEPEVDSNGAQVVGWVNSTVWNAGWPRYTQAVYAAVRSTCLRLLLCPV